MASPDEGSLVSARSGIDPAEEREGPDDSSRERGETVDGVDGPTGEHEQAYGPIKFRRYFKGDGRALILYTHREPADREPVDGEPADREPADGEPADGHPTGGGPGREEPAHE